MTIESEFQQVWNVTATEDLTGAGNMFKAVSIAGTIAAGPTFAIGILRSKGVSGQQVSAVVKGVTKVMVGTAVSTLGHPLKIAATSGWLAAAASGDVHVGRALALAASGDLVTAAVDFATKPAWPGV